MLAEKRADDKNLMWKIRKKIIGSEKETFYTVKDENDNPIMTRTEGNERYAKYFETLYQTREPEEGMEEWIKLVQDRINAPITQCEIRNAIKQLKSNKACGPDQIPKEIFINRGNEIIKDLHL